MIHKACRSCHAPEEAGAPADPPADCARCHVPARDGPYLRLLVPSASVVLDVGFGGPVPAGAGEAWADDLRRRLADEGVAAAPAGTAGAVPVSVRVTLDLDDGLTDAGTTFLGASARARLRIGRRTFEFQGRAFAGTDADSLARAAIDDLLGRLTLALTS